MPLQGAHLKTLLHWSASKAVLPSSAGRAGYSLLTLLVESGWPGYAARLGYRSLRAVFRQARVLKGDDSMEGVSDPLLPWGEEDEDVRQEREHLQEHGVPA